MITLADLVRRYQVCWEVWPEVTLIDGRASQVGFELELSGSDKHIEEFHPSCAECVRINVALESIAGSVLEKSENVITEINASGQSLRYSAVRGSRPDVTLSIKILHRNGYQNPIDDSERNCLEDVKTRLRALGACERHWYAALDHQEKMLVTV
jgi:hypothetical protein